MSLAKSEKDKLDALEYINHKFHNIPKESSWGKYVIEFPILESGTLKVWIIFVNLVQKSLEGQNIISGQPMYRCMGRVLKGDIKDVFFQQAT